jgi:hypothetical protein
LKKKILKKYVIPISILVPIILFISSFILITKYSLSSYPPIIQNSEEFCLQGNFFLPTLFKTNSSIPVKREVKDPITIFNKYKIFAKEICFTPLELLPESQNYIMTLSYFDTPPIGLFERGISFQSESYPEVKTDAFNEDINRTEILKYELSDTEELFQYQLLANENTIICDKTDTLILCDTSDLNLEPQNTYAVSLVSIYKDSLIKILDTQSLKILNPLVIKNSSIENDEEIEDPALKKISLEANKNIIHTLDIVLTDSKENTIPIETTFNKTIISITPKQDFEQNEEYILTIASLMGEDGSYMENPYILNFSVADGPKISSSNIENGFSTTSNLIIYFNETLNSSQNIKNFITLDSKTEYSFSIYKNKLTINPSNSLSFCANHKLSIKDGIKSVNGLTSSKSYSYSFKTTCKKVYTIGKSVDGRSIYAYYFGTGSKKIIFYGAMHGSESNTKYTLYNWIDELEDNIEDIPDDKKIIVVPVLNPDGVSSSTRFNSNGVDLNRNFDSSTWTSGTYFLQKYYPMGGGDSPFSEPESRAIRDLILRESPYLTLSYHSAAGYVVPSNTSKGIELGKVYSNISGYKYVAPGTDDAFTYDITGAFGEWAQEHGYNSLTIELSSAYYNQFLQNRKAMWEMVNR